MYIEIYNIFEYRTHVLQIQHTYQTGRMRREATAARDPFGMCVAFMEYVF